MASSNISELGSDIITATHQNTDLAAVKVMQLYYERDFLAVDMGLVEKPRWSNYHTMDKFWARQGQLFGDTKKMTSVHYCQIVKFGYSVQQQLQSEEARWLI